MNRKLIHSICSEEYNYNNNKNYYSVCPRIILITITFISVQVTAALRDIITIILSSLQGIVISILSQGTKYIIIAPAMLFTYLI